jgi:hypothetical protein
MLDDQQQRFLRGLPFGGGVRGILIYCSEDYHSHSICDQWRSEKAWYAAALGLWSKVNRHFTA